MDTAEAQRRAHQAFGSQAKWTEEVRGVRIPAWFDVLRQDLHYAVRGLLRSPSFTLSAIAAISIGIGASTAVFSFVDRILFRPLPYAEEGRLVWLGMTAPISGGEFLLDYDYVQWRKQQTVFDSMTATSGVGGCDLTEGDPVALRCAGVSANFLATLGLQPQAGRDFSADDDRPGAPAVVLITHSLWMNRFGGNADAVSRLVELDGRPVRVIGVLPREFELPMLSKADILRPMQLGETLAADNPRVQFLQVFARLREHVTLQEARAKLDPLFRESLKTVPPNFVKEVQLAVRPLRERQVQESRRGALLLLAAVGLVFLISVANAANLLVARAAGRTREIAIRAAMGAGAGRLARQAFTESLLLSALGGAAGVGLAAGLLALFTRLAPAGIARLDEANLDWRVLSVSAGLSALSGLLFGLAPAMRRMAPESLTGGRVAGRRRQMLRPALVVVQVALSLILLCGAGLLLNSLWKLTNISLGMQPENLIAVQTRLPALRYPNRPQQLAFWEAVEQRLQRLPGIQGFAISDSLPPQGLMMTFLYAGLHVEGRPKAEAQGTGGMVGVRLVTPGYFRLLGISLRRGRFFTEEERHGTGSPQPVVLSESLARRLFPHGEDAVGRRIQREDTLYEVAGVAADVLNAGLVRVPSPEMYVLNRHDSAGAQQSNFIIVRAPSTLVPAIREEFRQLDPRLTLQVDTVEARVDRLRDQPRFQTLLLGGFALSGLLLAAIGLYGVISLLVTQRTPEIGVRMALGATPRSIRRLMLGQAGRWLFAGLVAGLGGAAAAEQWIKGMLYRTAAADPLAIGGAMLVLLIAGLLATWLPASRAARVDPVAALRAD